MESLLNGLLQFSRSGRIELKKENLDMNRLISSVLNSFVFQFSSKGVKLDVSEVPPCVGDERQISQVFSNIIDNALKYLSPAREGIIKISGNYDNGRPEYCIEDNGIGISRDYQDKIFEIFHQLNPRMEGEGLGLSIVQRIIERHNGKIWLVSEEDRGSRFYVSLQSI